jgi:hypothetical protein
MTTLGKIMLVSATLSLPGIALAGGYGTAGVKDASVGQIASSSGTIWCPKVKTEVPFELYAEMDCGDGQVGFATPQVAPERFGDEPPIRIGPFRLPPHVRSGPQPDSGDDTPLVRSIPESPESPTTPVVPIGVVPEPEPETPGPIGKWERLNELGVTPENYADQGEDFYQSVSEYIDSNPPNNDWSGFGR